MTTKKFYLITLFIIVFSIACISCGNGKRSNYTATSSETSKTDAQRLVPDVKPEFMPFPAMPEGEIPFSPVRQISDVGYQVSGKDHIASKSALNAVDPSDNTAYSIVSDNDNKLAYAQYNVGFLTTARPVKFDVVINKFKPEDEEETLPLNYYIGIANYTKYIWEWNGPYNDGDPNEFSITLNSESLRDRYVDRFGLLHFVVITSVKDSPKLSAKGRVGLSFKASTTTISPSYYPNNPHYVPIKSIYTGKKVVGSLASLALFNEPNDSLTNETFSNLLNTDRSSSALTSDQYVTIEWNHIAAFNEPDRQNEALTYQVYRKGRNDSAFIFIGNVKAPNTVYRDPVDNAKQIPPIQEPVPGETYQYSLSAVTPKDLYCPKSTPGDAVPQVLAPSGLDASIGKSDEILVSWDAVAGAVEYEIWVSYIADDPNMTKLVSIPAPTPNVTPVTYSDKTAEPGKVRYYRIKAIGFNSTNPNAISALSAEIYGVLGDVLFPPTDVAASDGTSTTAITVTWNAPTEGTVPEGYSIWRSNSETGEYSKVGEVGAVFTFDDTVPTNDTYWYKVKSTKAGVSDSDYSAQADSGIKKQPVMPPANLTASKGLYDTKITLTWEAPTTGLAPSKYLVFRSLKQDSDFVQIEEVSGATNYEDTKVPDGNTYWYKIKSQSGPDISGFSTEDSGYLMQLAPPLSLTASKNKYLDRVRVDWLAPDKGPIPDGYYVYRSDKPDTGFTEIAKISHPTLFCEDLLVPDGYVYYYKAVSYKNTYANSTDSNVDSGYVTQLTPPGDVKATDGEHSNKVVISWSHTSTQKPDGYDVYRATSEFGAYAKIGTVGYSTAYEDYSVPNGFAQWYKVVSVKKSFPDSLFSEANDGYITQLSAPTGITASDGFYTNKIRISWKHSTGVQPDGYDLFRATSQYGAYSKIVSLGYVSEYDDSSLTNLSTYWYKLKAVKTSFADSMFSSEDSGYYAQLNPPTAVSASDSTSGAKIVITWNHPTGQVPEGYDIYRYSIQSGTYSKISSVGYVTTYDDSSMPEAGTYWYKLKSTHSLYGDSIYSSEDSGSNEIKSDWWMFGLDQTHNRRSAYIGTATNSLKWSYTTGNMVRSSAAISADGTVYFGGTDNLLYAINPNGSLKWTYNVGNVNYSSPAIDSDGTIYVGASKLWAIKPDGKLKWSYTTGGSVNYSSPTIGSDGTVFIGCNDSKLYAVNSDGSLKWTYATGGEVRSSVAIAQNGAIFFGSLDKKLYALSAAGSLLWTYTAGDQIWSSPAIGLDGSVYFGCYDKKVYAISPAGSFLWSYDTGGWVTSSPAVNTDGSIVIGGWDNKVYVLNSNGTLKWTYKTGSIIHSSPAIGADGIIYVGSQDKTLTALNSNGTLKFTYPLTAYVLSSPSIGIDGTVYFGCDDYKMYAIGPGAGNSGLNPPSSISATDSTYSDRVRITWTAPAAGPTPDGYYIYRSTSSSSSAVFQYIGYTSTLLFDDTNATAGTTYYYKIRSYKYSSAYNDSVFSAYDAGTRN